MRMVGLDYERIVSINYERQKLDVTGPRQARQRPILHFQAITRTSPAINSSSIDKCQGCNRSL